MTNANIAFIVACLIAAYATGWTWAASMTYFKQFMEKIQ